ncbi:hypothetical protein ABW19_dt0209585 [Dactylella cylindrospora]|nr:hypothetical protein ABW19_dt0209585 [Dactylella cylindrospora]
MVKIDIKDNEPILFEACAERELSVEELMEFLIGFAELNTLILRVDLKWKELDIHAQVSYDMMLNMVELAIVNMSNLRELTVDCYYFAQRDSRPYVRTCDGKRHAHLQKIAVRFEGPDTRQVDQRVIIFSKLCKAINDAASTVSELTVAMNSRQAEAPVSSSPLTSYGPISFPLVKQLRLDIGSLTQNLRYWLGVDTENVRSLIIMSRTGNRARYTGAVNTLAQFPNVNGISIFQNNAHCIKDVWDEHMAHLVSALPKLRKVMIKRLLLKRLEDGFTKKWASVENHFIVDPSASALKQISSKERLF